MPEFFNARLRGGFALEIGMIFCGILVLLSLFVGIFNVPLTKLLAFGFSDELIILTAPLVAINFWYLLLIFIVTLFGAMLQFKRNFTAWAYSPALLNLVMICALLLARNSESYQAILILSYGVLGGGIAQILLHCYPMWRLGFFNLLLAGFKELQKNPLMPFLHIQTKLHNLLQYDIPKWTKENLSIKASKNFSNNFFLQCLVAQQHR